jgi:hypothetical protein
VGLEWGWCRRGRQSRGAMGQLGTRGLQGGAQCRRLQSSRGGRARRSRGRPGARSSARRGAAAPRAARPHGVGDGGEDAVVNAVADQGADGLVDGANNGATEALGVTRALHAVLRWRAGGGSESEVCEAAGARRGSIVVRGLLASPAAGRPRAARRTVNLSLAAAPGASRRTMRNAQWGARTRGCAIPTIGLAARAFFCMCLSG